MSRRPELESPSQNPKPNRCRSPYNLTSRPTFLGCVVRLQNGAFVHRALGWGFCFLGVFGFWAYVEPGYGNCLQTSLPYYFPDSSISPHLVCICTYFFRFGYSVGSDEILLELRIYYIYICESDIGRIPI